MSRVTPHVTASLGIYPSHEVDGLNRINSAPELVRNIRKAGRENKARSFFRPKENARRMMETFLSNSFPGESTAACATSGRSMMETFLDSSFPGESTAAGATSGRSVPTVSSMLPCSKAGAWVAGGGELTASAFLHRSEACALPTERGEPTASA